MVDHRIFNSSSEKLANLAKTVRILSAEAVQQANSGHPGMPMGAADYASLLWSDFMRFSPSNPEWLGRDRFVLSAGHGSMLLYSLLHLFGFDLPLSEIKNFRQWESKTPGHPEYGLTAGVETTTGPLGQGFANGVGMALSEKMLAERYSEDLFGNLVYGIVSDGDLMEGVASEAASMAGHLKLGNLIYLYDDNQISIGGRTDVCFTESVPKRFESYGWHVTSCDAHDFDAIRKSLTEAVGVTDRPSIICAKSIIGLGSPNKKDSAGVHGSPLGDEELALTKKELGWEHEESFHIPSEVSDFCKELAAAKEAQFASWTSAFESWRKSEPQKATALEQQCSRKVSAELEEELLKEIGGNQEKQATRAISGNAIQIIAKHVPWFVGGSADLEPSNKTLIKDSTDISAESFSGRNIRFGVREHGMGSLVNGLAYSKMWAPYSATFLVFADYMRPPMRLAALSHLQSIFIFTHDSFWVGEDGPTHEPIEHIQSLRIIPNLDVYRPADGMETAVAYLQALESTARPSALLFTRQGVPALKRDSSVTADDIRKGAYVVSNQDVTEHVIVATGSEVWLACDAAKIIEEKKGISFRIVSAPCLDRFLQLSEEEQQKIIPVDAKRVSIEAGVTSGWQEIVGDDGLTLGIDHFGASAPGAVLAEKFGFTPESVAATIEAWL